MLTMSEINGLATRTLLDQPSKRRFTEVDIPECGKFRLRSFSELEKSRIDAAVIDRTGKVNVAKAAFQNARAIVAAWVDCDGNLICTDSDIQKVADLDSRITSKLMDAINELNGSRHTGEELEKN